MAVKIPARMSKALALRAMNIMQVSGPMPRGNRRNRQTVDSAEAEGPQAESNRAE